MTIEDDGANTAIGGERSMGGVAPAGDRVPDQAEKGVGTPAMSKVGARQVRSHAHKIRALIDLSGADEPSVRSAIRRRGGHSAQLGDWLAGGNMQTASKDRLIACLSELGLTGLTKSIFDLTDEAFDAYVADHATNWGKTLPSSISEPSLERRGRRVDIPAEISKLLARFEGCYQIIRPHTIYTDRYILEPLQIGGGNPPTINMYSHHNAPDEKWIYTGEGTVSSRYCFTLLRREHEAFADLSAYRALAFYFGPEAIEDYFSGLILRGLTDAALQLASMPFVAIRVADRCGLRPVSPQSAKPGPNSGSPKLRRLREDSALLLGTAARGRYPDVYAACDTVFRRFRASMERERKGEGGESNPANQGLVLQTIKPGELDDRLELREEVWRDVVAHLEFT